MALPTYASYLCAGDLLRLDVRRGLEKQRLKLFQRKWNSAQPVMVVGVETKLNRELWTPETFNKYFGRNRNEVINSLTGRTLAPQPMSIFWDGFADYKSKFDIFDQKLLKTNFPSILILILLES